MKSFSIIKKNVGLTTNVKLVVDSNYNLYLDSIESSSELSDFKFKKVQFNKSNYYDELIPYFYDGLDASIAFGVKYDDDNTTMYNTFDKQIDDMYIMGCENITDNKYYTEDFEYFAPLYVSKTGLPKYFAIFRVDGPGINTVNKDNFRTEILNKLKCVKIVDLTKNSDIGQWLYNNVTNNKSFPLTAFEIDFRDSELSYWNGIDLINGCYTQKAYFFDTKLNYENTFNDLEKFVYDGFKNNNIVYPNIINFSFLFDDQPATTTSLRKWSLNRYSGFYLEDMLLSKSVTTYLPSILQPDAMILSGNILTNGNNIPFSDSTLQLDKIFIEYYGNFYPVNKITKNIAGISTTQWIIISDIDLSGQQSIVNNNVINIDTNNKITYINGNPFTIDDWNTADVWLIEINNIYHNIQKEGNDYYIYTDYGFNIASNTLSYFINSPDPSYNTTIDMISGASWTASNVPNNIISNNTPTSFGIYKFVFTDIKSFDEHIIDTDFSKFEYDIDNEVVQTDETKLYFTNLDSTDNPKSKMDYQINNLTVNIPVASHYNANSELFRIENNDLSPIWRKNAEFVKWGFKNSLSASDYPYLLNNSFIGEDFNRTADTFLSNPSRVSRNLDYFYSINSSTMSYSYHSLHIESSTVSQINTTYSFDIAQYLNLSYDYFTSFFDRKIYLNNSTIIKNVTKYSYFNSGDNSLPNITLFRGLKLRMYDVDTVKIYNNQLQSINIKCNNSYEDYKFSILLSTNNLTIETDSKNLNQLSITASNNSLQWTIIDNWKHEKEYDPLNITNYLDILYIALTTSSIIDPTINPSNSTDWTFYTASTLFWSPTVSYGAYSFGAISSTNSIVYNSGEYYYNNGMTSSTFYNPNISYSYNSVVLYNNKVWMSTTSSNTIPPDTNNIWRDVFNSNPTSYWLETSNTDYFGDPMTTWTIIQLWDSLSIYNTGDTVIYNEVLYYTTAVVTTIGVTPDSTTDWIQLYSFVPNTNYVYGTNINANNIIKMNNRYYLCTSNANNSTLDNGINIFINNKHKNVLVNIYVNDNTLTNISNIERDVLYKDIYSNLTAFNFINAINDVNNNYGFTNKLKYIVFDDSGTNIYDFDQLNSFKNLTNLLIADGPDEFRSRIMSLSKISSTLTKSQFTAKSVLNDGNIVTQDQINYYNNVALGNTIDQIMSDPQIIPNYSGIQNKLFNILYRHSGYYDPIFKNIDLFQKGLTYSGNILFDTELTNFGTVHQIISKINRGGSILKLKNSANLKSIYPMVDEFGYTVNEIFIFQSNWDSNYFVECTPIITSNNILNIQTENVAANKSVVFIPVEATPKKLS